ncbi:MAG: YezD family protein [Treponema sp.]|nr:YezD family protein [Treponema sp.]
MGDTIVIKKHSDYPHEFAVIAEYVKQIQFGSVTLQIENGRIIQIDKNEKFRFDKQKKA